MRVLVVHPDPDVGKIASAELAGHHVRWVPDITTATDVLYAANAQQERFDVILTDLDAPEGETRGQDSTEVGSALLNLALITGVERFGVVDTTPNAYSCRDPSIQLLEWSPELDALATDKRLKPHYANRGMLIALYAAIRDAEFGVNWAATLEAILAFRQLEDEMIV